MEKVNIPIAAEELSAYAAQRLAGFEQHRLGGAYRQPETFCGGWRRCAARTPPRSSSPLSGG